MRNYGAQVWRAVSKKKLARRLRRRLARSQEKFFGNLAQAFRCFIGSADVQIDAVLLVVFAVVTLVSASPARFVPLVFSCASLVALAKWPRVAAMVAAMCALALTVVVYKKRMFAHLVLFYDRSSRGKDRRPTFFFLLRLCFDLCSRGALRLLSRARSAPQELVGDLAPCERYVRTTLYLRTAAGFTPAVRALRAQSSWCPWAGGRARLVLVCAVGVTTASAACARAHSCGQCFAL